MIGLGDSAPGRQPVYAVATREVKTLLVCGHRRVLPIAELPELLPRFCIEGECTPLQRREVDDAVDDRGRAGDRPAGVEGPADLTGARVESIKTAGVGAGVDRAVPDGGRRVHVAAGGPGPQQVPG